MSKDLNDYTVVELKEKAKELKIDGYRAMKKDDLIEAIEGASKQENVVKTTPVETSVAEKKPAKSVKRKLQNDDEIEVMNNTTGRYGYIGRSGFAMDMTEYGDILEIPFGELKRMRSEQKRHIEDAFIIILNGDAVKELRYEKLYENVFDKDSVEDLLQNPVKLAEVLPKMPSTMRETVGSIAIRRIKNNEIFDMRIKRAVEKSLGITIEA